MFASALALRSIDARTGEQQQVWAHAPWPIISALWSFFRANKTRGIFVVPHFPQEQWFNRIMWEATRVTCIAHKHDENVYITHSRSGKVISSSPATVDLYALVFDFTS